MSKKTTKKTTMKTTAKKAAKKTTKKPDNRPVFTTIDDKYSIPANQCPRCGKLSSEKAVKLGSPNRQYINGERDGKRYTLIERQRIICEHCCQIHFVRQYK